MYSSTGKIGRTYVHSDTIDCAVHDIDYKWSAYSVLYRLIYYAKKHPISISTSPAVTMTFWSKYRPMSLAQQEDTNAKHHRLLNNVDTVLVTEKRYRIAKDFTSPQDTRSQSCLFCALLSAMKQWLVVSTIDVWRKASFMRCGCMRLLNLKACCTETRKEYTTVSDGLFVCV